MVNKQQRFANYFRRKTLYMIKLRDLYAEELVTEVTSNLGKVNLLTAQEFVSLSENVSRSLLEIQQFVAVSKTSNAMRATTRFLEECLEEILAVEYSRASVRCGLNKLSAFADALNNFTKNDHFDGFSLRESFYGSAAGSLLEVKDDLTLFESIASEIYWCRENLSEAFPKLPGMVLKEEVATLSSSYRKTHTEYLKEASAVPGGLRQMVKSVQALRNKVELLGSDYKRVQAGLQSFTKRVQNAVTGGIKLADRPERVMAQTQLVLGMFETYMRVIPDLIDLFSDVLERIDGNPGARYAPENKDGVDKFQAALKRELNGNFSAKISRLFGRKNVIFPSEINPQMLIDDTIDLIVKDEDSSRAGPIAEGLQNLMRSVESLKKGQRIELAPEVSGDVQTQPPGSSVNRISGKAAASQTQTTVTPQSEVPFYPMATPKESDDYAKKTMEEFNALGLSQNERADFLSELVDDLNNGKEPREAFANFLAVAKSSLRKKTIAIPLSDKERERETILPPNPATAQTTPSQTPSVPSQSQ